jgi:hypothetical protein
VNPQDTYERADAGIFLALMGGSEEGAMQQREKPGLTWPQIRYWLTCAGLIVLGGAMAIGGHAIPWEWAQTTVKEVGSGLLIAGILGSFVEPFFRKEFARDSFLAAFRRVLPDEFKEEVEKIIRFEFIAEKQVWSVKIDKITDKVVRVTTSFERTVENKSKSNRPVQAWYEAEDFNFCEGVTEMIECGVEGEDPSQSNKSTTSKRHQHHVEIKTPELPVRPGKKARVWGKAIQYRRTNDCMWENFRVPIVNPEIEVLIDENEFSHEIQFGTPADWTKSEYGNHYTLSGVYFPGQFMFVRWWPKKIAHQGS